jgi:hypothetical protein
MYIYYRNQGALWTHFCTNAEAIDLALGLNEAQPSFMGRTKRKPETIYIDHEKSERLKQLAKTTRIPRAVLWREALDDLLRKHEVSGEKQRNP